MGIEEIIKKTKKLETILTKMGATGKGLHEKVSSIEHRIDKKTIKPLRYIATIRNKAVHEEEFITTEEISNSFKSNYEYIICKLDGNTSVAKQGYCDVTNNKIKNKEIKNTPFRPSNNKDRNQVKEEHSGWELLGIAVVGVAGVFAWLTT